MATKGRKRSDEEVERRRANVYQTYLTGWSPVDRQRLRELWQVSDRQLYQDIEVVRAESRKRLDPAEREGARELLLAQLERVKTLASRAVECRTCRGSGYLADLECGSCSGAGVAAEADARWGRVLVQAVEAAAKLLGLSQVAPPQVQITLQQAGPAELLSQLQIHLQLLQQTGAGALPVIEAESE